VGVDNNNDYYAVNFKYARLNRLGTGKEDVEYNIIAKSKINDKFEFIKLNLGDTESSACLFEKYHFYVVCNLGA